MEERSQQIFVHMLSQRSDSSAVCQHWFDPDAYLGVGGEQAVSNVVDLEMT